MKIRGERKCKQCGTRWTYYETGSVECPECGSLQSVGVDERTEHTASAVELDLSDVRGALDDVSTGEIAERAAESCREFVRQTGFIDAGNLQILTERYVTATELRYVGDELSRRMRIDDPEEAHLLSLLQALDTDNRPPAESVPSSLEGARGLALTSAVDAYHSDLKRLDREFEPAVTSLLSRIRDHRKRIEALDGDVEARTSERLFRAIQEVGRYVVSDDETALARAEEYLDGLA